MDITISGVEAKLIWGYRPAATLRAWTLIRQEAGAWVLTGTIAQKDDFAISQRSLKFVAPHLERPITELQITGALLTATLGPAGDSDGKMPLRSE